MFNDNLNLLILNTDKDFSSFYMDLYKLIFKHNYSVKILDVSDDVNNLNSITKTIFKINPLLLCIRVFDYSMLPLIKSIIEEIYDSYADTLIVVCDVSPNNKSIREIGGLNCDFYCEENINDTILNMLKFFGNKEVDSRLLNIWLKEGKNFTFIE